MEAKEVRAKFNVNPQQLYLWRRGYAQKKTDVNGRTVKYHYPPRLFEGVHYKWNRGRIEYTDEGVRQIRKLVMTI